MPYSLFTDVSMLNEFLRAVPQEYGTFGYLKELKDGEDKQIVIEKPKGFQSLNYIGSEYLLEKQLADMEKAGVDQAIMKLPGCQEWLTLELCKRFNNEAYNHTQRSGGKLKALAVVPPYDDEECLAELERAIYELGFAGVQVSAHYGNLYLDNEIFKPFFRKVNEMNIPVYVHHTPVPVQFDSIYEFNNLRRTYGRCIDQSIAVGREIFSGMFEEFPNLKLIHSMLGGGFFTNRNMLFPKSSGNGRFEVGSDKYEDYLRNNIYFEMSHAQPWGKTQLECAVEVLGADHIIYGSSYPVKEQWLMGGPDFVMNLNISSEDKNKILYENAKEIYRV
ncbi:amidohydrolase family protein [Paenibacillus pinistramenti]|uniref:amidohydrolase family protein n=1 Tax=Paenibacillus pinistramenti TaxID=1768003 RepID=UPI001939B8CF|nr:amidohydrolase family protein [Paenibacillus pinistramenti]